MKMKNFLSISIFFAVTSSALGQGWRGIDSPRALHNPALEKRLKSILAHRTLDDFGPLEVKYLKLLDEFNTPEDTGAIYAAIVYTYATSPSGGKWRDKAYFEIQRSYAEAALARPLDRLTRYQMFDDIVYAEGIDLRRASRSRADIVRLRPQYAASKLKRLKFLIEMGVPIKRQFVPLLAIDNAIFPVPVDPATGKMDTSTRQYKAYVDHQREQAELWKEYWQAKMFNELVRLRGYITMDIINLYINDDDLDELKQAAIRVLQALHTDVINELVQMTEMLSNTPKKQRADRITLIQNGEPADVPAKWLPLYTRLANHTLRNYLLEPHSE